MPSQGNWTAKYFLAPVSLSLYIHLLHQHLNMHHSYFNNKETTSLNSCIPLQQLKTFNYCFYLLVCFPPQPHLLNQPTSVLPPPTFLWELLSKVYNNFLVSMERVPFFLFLSNLTSTTFDTVDYFLLFENFLLISVALILLSFLNILPQSYLSCFL